MTFVVAKPWADRRELGEDFNDLLRERGLDAIDERLCIALEPGGRSRKLAPMGDVEQRVRETIAAERDRVLATPYDKGAPRPVLAVKAGTSTRKTDAAIRAAIAVCRIGPVFIGVPRLELADEIAERVRSVAVEPNRSVDVGVYRGADQHDPQRPGHLMCDNVEDRREAETRGLDATKTVCVTCPLRDGCGRLRQKGEGHDIWIGTVNLLYGNKPAEMGKVAWLIADENSINAALIGAGEIGSDDGPVLLAFDAWRGVTQIAGDAKASERLAESRLHALALLQGAPDGPLTRRALSLAGVTADTAHQAHGLEYAGLAEAEVDQDMCHADAMEAVRAVDNRGVKQRAMFWREVERLARDDDGAVSGRIELVTLADGEGRAVRMKGMRPIGRGWNAPLLVIDATMQEVQFRTQNAGARFEDIGMADAPHRQIRQVIDSTYSLAMLDADAPSLSPKERHRRGNHLRRLHAWLSSEAAKSRAFGEKVLIVAQKRIEAQLRAIGEIAGVSWGHHGAMTGVDVHRDAGHIIVIGRTMPKPEAVEAMAEAATGKVVRRLPVGSWYPLVDGWREMSDGSLVACETVRHPDPLAESFRWRA